MNNDGLKITIGVLAAIFVALLITIVLKSGSSANGTQVTAGPTTDISRITPVAGVIGSVPVSPPNSSVGNGQSPVSPPQQNSDSNIDCPPRLEGNWAGTWTSSVTRSFSGTWNSSVQANGSSFTGSVTLISPTTSTVPVEGSINCSDMTLKVPGLFEAIGKLDATGRNVSGSYQYITGSERGQWNGSFTKELSTPLVSALPPTLTPVPLPPTSTPVPPPPTATPDLNTPDGAVLTPDQKWVKDGVTVSLMTDPNWFTPGGVEGWGDCWRQYQDLKFYVRVKNGTSQPIFFDVGKNNYVVRTSTGQVLTITEYDLCTSIGSMSIGPGIETVHTNGPVFSGEGVGDLRVSVTGDYTGADVDYIDIQLVNFSRIQLATWRIPINH